MNQVKRFRLNDGERDKRTRSEPALRKTRIKRQHDENIEVSGFVIVWK